MGQVESFIFLFFNLFFPFKVIISIKNIVLSMRMECSIVVAALPSIFWLPISILVVFLSRHFGLDFDRFSVVLTIGFWFFASQTVKGFVLWSHSVKIASFFKMEFYPVLPSKSIIKLIKCDSSGWYRVFHGNKNLKKKVSVPPFSVR